MYVAPFSLSSFSVSHLHPSLPTYLYVHFSTLESFKLSSTWAFAHIRTYPCACIPCIRACLRTRTTRSFPNSGESTYHRLFIYQPSSAFSTINPIILDRYFLFLLSFFFFPFFQISHPYRSDHFRRPTCFSTNFIAITIRLHSDDRLILITIVYRFVKRVVYVG